MKAKKKPDIILKLDEILELLKDCDGSDEERPISNEILFLSLHAAIYKGITDFNRSFLTPWVLGPFLEDPEQNVLRKLVIRAMRWGTTAEAVSLFLASSEEPNKLNNSADDGYFEGYSNWSYDINDYNAFTSHVFRKGVPINKSFNDIEEEGLPFSGRCFKFINSLDFKNIMAIPLKYGSRTLGILKFENWNNGQSNSDQIFPEYEYTYAKALGTSIALAYTQRLYSQIWNRGEKLMRSCDDLEQYCEECSVLLRELFLARSACIYTLEKHDKSSMFLKLRGGVNYESESILKDDLLPFTLAKSNFFEPRLFGFNAIMKMDKKYANQILDEQGKGELKNVMVQALCNEDREIIGFIQIINVLADEHVSKRDFNDDSEEEDDGWEKDTRILKSLSTRQIIPILLNFSSTVRQSPGVRYLSEKIGPPKTLNTSARQKRLMQVYKLYKELNTKDSEDGRDIRNEIKLTKSDCAAYLKISLSYYNTLEAKLRISLEEKNGSTV